MVFYCNDTWVAFLCESIVRRACQKTLENCPACKSKLKSPILHLHEQLALLEKIKIYFEEIRGAILHDISKYYDCMSSNLPHSDDKKKDKLLYINIGRNFLITATADSIYYGRFVDEHNDCYIDEQFSKGLMKN